MIVRLSDYRVNYPFIKMMLEKEQPDDVVRFVSIMAVSIGVPVIVVAHYTIEIIGASPELQEQIEMLTKFYGYTEIKE